jgi:hypothetical protein
MIGKDKKSTKNNTLNPNNEALVVFCKSVLTFCKVNIKEIMR